MFYSHYLLFHPFHPCLNSFVFVLTNRNKGISELKKEVESGELRLFQPHTTHFYPLFKTKVYLILR